MEEVKFLKIPLTPYPVTLIVAIGENAHGAENYVEDSLGQGIKIGDTSCGGWVNKHRLITKDHGSRAILMWLSENCGYATIAHEAYHVVRGVYEIIHSDGKEEEPFAYMIGYIVNEIVKNISSVNK